MKKSKAVQLILITAALASCNRPGVASLQNYPPDDIYGDSASYYTYSDAPYLWRYSFRPYGHFFYGRHHAYWHQRQNNNRTPYAYHPRPKGFARTTARGGFGHAGHSHGGFAHA